MLDLEAIKRYLGPNAAASDDFLERAAAALIAEVERLRASLGAVSSRAARVMSMLSIHGGPIVPHLLDTDDNAGSHLCKAIQEARKLLEQE